MARDHRQRADHLRARGSRRRSRRALNPNAPTGRLLDRFILLVVGIAWAWNVVGNLVLPGALYVPANLALAGLLVVLARRAGFAWDDLGLGRGSAWRGVAIGLLAAAVIAAVLAIALNIALADELLEDDGVLADSRFDRWFVPAIRIPFGTAIFEEILFRSVLFAALAARWDRWWAVVGSSLLFGLWHIVPEWETTSGGAGTVLANVAVAVGFTTAVGALLAWLRVWSRSIVAPTLAHAAANSFAYVAALVALDLV